MLTLGIETSCDETGISLVEDGKVLSNEISSSVHLHSRYGGVIPEIASRHHVEYISAVLDKALSDASKDISQVDLVSVTRGPGLPGSLLVGLSFAKAISFSLDVPLVAVDHIMGHIFSAFLGSGREHMPEDLFPFLGMVVSGGHTSLYVCRGIGDMETIGRTRDDAAGEAFDKIAKMLGLGYPGGPAVEKMARKYDGSDMISFPRALLKDAHDLDFSFSGIKTAVMYHLRGSERSDDEISRVCASFQEAVVDVIGQKISRAVRMTGIDRFAVGGGVINNSDLRGRVTSLCREMKVELFLPEKSYCADNGAMVAFVGEQLFRSGRASGLDVNARPAGD